MSGSLGNALIEKYLKNNSVNKDWMFSKLSENIDNIKSGLILGNNFDEGLSIYKGGKNNIFTPGYFVCALSLAWPDGHIETFEGEVIEAIDD